MTSLSILSDPEKESPSIVVTPTHTIADISPLLYGGFTE